MKNIASNSLVFGLFLTFSWAIAIILAPKVLGFGGMLIPPVAIIFLEINLFYRLFKNKDRIFIVGFFVNFLGLLVWIFLWIFYLSIFNFKKVVSGEFQSFLPSLNDISEVAFYHLFFQLTVWIIVCFVKR